MTKRDQTRQNEQAFLFTVDILVRGRSNGAALERVVSLLNGSEEIVDYRVTDGLRLGCVIDEAIRLSRQDDSAKPGDPHLTEPSPSPAAAEPGQPAGKGGSAARKETGNRPDRDEQAGGGKKGTSGKTGKPSGESGTLSPLLGQISEYIASRQLVRLTVLKGRGVKLSIPCRLLNYDESANNLTVYHVDEKKVYTVKLAEIDDLTVT
jgi:hypothetical protein